MEEVRDLYSYLDRLVEVTTKTNSRVIQGIVVTIDPETKMMLMINKDNHSKFHIINGDMINSKTIVDPATSYEQVTQECLKNLYNRPNEIDALVRKTLSNNSKGIRLTELLKKSGYEIINEKGVLKISDQLIILPPYGAEQCISSDKTLLEGVKSVISQSVG